jgi:hypothetical protein
MLLEVGSELVELASQGFPKGTAVEQDDVEAAIARTHELCASKKALAIFHGVFRHQDVQIATDIVLATGDGSLDLFEVKAGTAVKPRHVLDLALQVHVLEQLGYRVRHMHVLHLNPHYKHEGGSKYPVHQLFKSVDVAEKVRKHVGSIAERLESFRLALGDESTLSVPTGSWCMSTFPCYYLPFCLRNGPPHPLIELPGLNKQQTIAFRQRGAEDLSRVDGKQPGLSLVQRRALRSVQGNELVVEPHVREEFDEVEPPIHFVWVEYLLDVLPRYASSRPWQKIPFLWAAVSVDADGRSTQTSFVPDGREDPRAEFVRTLLEGNHDAASLVFYDQDHEARLKELLEDLPEQKADVRALLNSPFLEMQSLLRSGAYHPEFRGRFDLEAVHAALCGPEGGDEGESQTPHAMAAAIRRLANSRTRATTRAKLVQDLDAYARRQATRLSQVYSALTTGVRARQ